MPAVLRLMAHAGLLDKHFVLNKRSGGYDWPAARDRSLSLYGTHTRECVPAQFGSQLTELVHI